MFFVALFVVVEVLGIRSQVSPDNIKNLFMQHPFLGSGLFCLAFGAGNLLYVPGWIFLVGAVFALGKEWGGLVTYLAALFSATISFFLIGFVSRDAMRSLDGEIAEKMFARLDRAPIMAIAVLRLVFQTVPALNYALAMAGVRFHHYLVGTMIGLPLPIFLYCYFFEFFLKILL